MPEMKRYRVTVICSTYTAVYVEAPNENAAEDIARNEPEDHDSSEFDSCVTTELTTAEMGPDWDNPAFWKGSDVQYCECGAALGDGGDGYDGMCADCADRAENAHTEKVALNECIG